MRRLPLLCAALFGLRLSCESQSGHRKVDLRVSDRRRTVTAQDDLDPTQAGVQVNVTVRAVSIPDGTVVTLTNSVDVDGTGAPWRLRLMLSGGQAVFAAYTLPTVKSALTVKADKAQAAINVTVGAISCTFVSPSNGAVITASAYPDPADPYAPIEQDVITDCQGVKVTDHIALTVNGGLAIFGQVAQGGSGQRHGSRHVSGRSAVRRSGCPDYFSGDRRPGLQPARRRDPDSPSP